MLALISCALDGGTCLQSSDGRDQMHHQPSRPVSRTAMPRGRPSVSGSASRSKRTDTGAASIYSPPMCNVSYCSKRRCILRPRPPEDSRAGHKRMTPTRSHAIADRAAVAVSECRSSASEPAYEFAASMARGRFHHRISHAAFARTSAIAGKSAPMAIFRDPVIQGVVRITSDVPAPHVVMFCGIHGDEVSGIHAIEKVLFDFFGGTSGVAAGFSDAGSCQRASDRRGAPIRQAQHEPDVS